MKKIAPILAIIFLSLAACTPDQGDKPLVVFMGDSITEEWEDKSSGFFEENGYVNKGIGGQVTREMLARFEKDVIDLNPKVVVILARTNDIAQNDGFMTIDAIAENIFSMAELADSQGIKVILCSVLPTVDYPWKRGLEPAPKIIQLNEMLETYAAENQFLYVDYYSAMVDSEGGLKAPNYTSKKDLVHPNKRGYKVMEGLIVPAVEEALRE